MMRSASEQAKRKDRPHDADIYRESVRRHTKLYDAPLTFVQVHGVAARGELDLVQQLDATLLQLLQLDKIGPNDRPLQVVINLDDVTVIDPAALLFLCSRIHKLAGRPWVWVTGTWPKAQSALQTLADADFPSFLRKATPLKITPPNTLQLIDGSGPGSRFVSVGAAERIASFLAYLHPGLVVKELDALGAAVNECLENVRLHAYLTRSARKRGWYVVGSFDANTSTSTVAILDMGVGIAASVAPQFRFKGRLRRNEDLLEAATAGRATASGEKHRGQGFKFLREFVMEKDLRRLHVLSSSAMITWGRSGTGGILARRRTRHFEGTIVCLQITNEPSL